MISPVTKKLAPEQDLWSFPENCVGEFPLTSTQKQTALLPFTPTHRIPVAIKFFQQTSPELRLWDLIEMFDTEVDMLSEFKHPSIVRMLGSVSTPERCIVLERMYSSVEERLDAKGCAPMGWKQRLDVATETANALDYLHSMFLVHRDIKTSNLLIDDHGRTKLADFGTCIDEPEKVATPSSGTVRLVGSDEYLAPDYRADGIVDRTVDTYAFGVVLLELLTGLPPLDSAALAKTLGDVDPEGMMRTVTDSRALWPEPVMKALVSLARKCLHPSRDHRCTMNEIGDVLGKLQVAHGTPAQIPSQSIDAPPTTVHAEHAETGNAIQQPAALHTAAPETTNSPRAAEVSQAAEAPKASCDTKIQQDATTDRQLTPHWQPLQGSKYGPAERLAIQFLEAEQQREQEVKRAELTEHRQETKAARQQAGQQAGQQEDLQVEQQAKPQQVSSEHPMVQRVRQLRQEKAAKAALQQQQIEAYQLEAYQRQQEAEALAHLTTPRAPSFPPPSPPPRFAPATPVLRWPVPHRTGIDERSSGWFSDTSAATTTVGVVVAGSLAVLLGPCAAAPAARWGSRSVVSRGTIRIAQ
jgi:interleukin-1 receptor-associated kinase 4